MESRKAQSRYRQARLTFTSEVGGRCSYSLYVKPLNAAWDSSHLVVRDVLTLSEPPDNLDDVLHALIEILLSLALPESHGSE